MYAFESSKRKSAFHVLIVTCFAVALLLFGVSGVEGLAFPMLYQITAVVFLVAGVYLLSRYALKTYRYEVSESNIADAMGQPILDLVITEISGRRVTVVARVALRDIAAVEDINKTQDKALAKEREDRLLAGRGGERAVVFRYLNTPFVTHACYISVPSERSVLVIPPDEQMMRMLRGGMGGDSVESF